MGGAVDPHGTRVTLSGEAHHAMGNDPIHDARLQRWCSDVCFRDAASGRRL